MKLIRILIPSLTLATSLLADAPLIGETAPAPIPLSQPAKLDGGATAHVAVDVAAYAVPDEQALVLLGELRDPTKIDDAARRLEAMVAKKEAQLLAWPQLSALTGQRAHSGTADEFRFPTEFNPAPDPADNDDAEAFSGPEAKPKLVGKRVTPTTFETRDLGAQLEITPVLSDDAQRVVLGVVS